MYFSRAACMYLFYRPFRWQSFLSKVFTYNILLHPKTRNKCLIKTLHLNISSCSHFSSSMKTVLEKPVNLESLTQYEHVAEESLQSITEKCEEILENSNIEDWDVNYSNGVLKISLNKHGVYVLNKQTPNRQIWLSSPLSGPKRYDYTDGKWIYKHDGISLHHLLSYELSDILKEMVDFKTCTFGS